MPDRLIVDSSITAICPVCERKEDFDNGAMARAWLTEHILQVHGDELPDYT